MQKLSERLEELLHKDAPRLLSDTDVGRLFGFSAAYVPTLRQKSLLAKRKKVAPGAHRRKGVQRYNFLEAVAAEVARISKAEFGWPDRVLHRVASLINSGDLDAVRAATVVAFKGDIPGTFSAVFFAPGELAEGTEFGKVLARAAQDDKILQKVSLLDIVEHVANILYDKMVRAGFEFSGVASPIKKKTRRRRS